MRVPGVARVLAVLALALPLAACHGAAEPHARPSPPPIVVDDDTVAPPYAAGPPAPRAGGVARALAAGLADPQLGSAVAYVADAASAASLVERGSDRAVTPASVAKIATAVSALAVLGPDRRFVTRVARAADGGLVLVGGGDPTLAGPRSQAGYPSPARLADLARDTARAVGAGTRVRLSVDDSLFAGPRTAPGWRPTYIPEGSVAPVSALALDGARLRPDEDPRTVDARAADPALHAGTAFAATLRAAGLEVEGAVRRTVLRGATMTVAEVRSPPLGALVQRLLASSDNDLAEALARHVALASGHPGTFAGAAAALSQVLHGLGVDGVALVDGSGLSVLDRATPRAVAALLLLALDPARPDLAPVATALPVAGFTGTLRDRFVRASAGRGVVRAKTGTLSGVSTLAGYVLDADGRLLVFVLSSQGGASTLRTQRALDAVAATLAACGCR